MEEKFPKSWHQHVKLYRDIGDEIPNTSPDFNRFKRAIPMTERDKTENITSVEDLLNNWERRGGIGVGNYGQLRQLLHSTNLMKVLDVADEQIYRIMTQLIDEEGTLGPYKDYLSSNSSSTIQAPIHCEQEHSVKRIGSKSVSEQFAAIQIKCMSQSANLSTSQSQPTGASLDNSLSTLEPSDSEPRTIKRPPDTLMQCGQEHLVKRKRSESLSKQFMAIPIHSTSQSTNLSTSQSQPTGASLDNSLSTPESSVSQPRTTKRPPDIQPTCMQCEQEHLVKRKRSESLSKQFMAIPIHSTSQSTNLSTSQSQPTGASLDNSLSTPEPSEFEPKTTKRPPDIQPTNLNLIQRELQNWYINTLSRLHPIPWCDFLELDLDHVFTNLKIIRGKKDQSCPGSNSDVGDIETLSCLFNNNFSKKSVCLIEGPAGIGKSTLCRRLVHLWSNNNYSIDGHSFDLAFLLEASLLTGNLKNCIKEQLFAKDFELSEDNIYECLRNRQNKCLLIIDGIDELTSEGKDLVKGLLKGDNLRHVNLLLTGRPEASMEYLKDVNKHFQIEGFSFKNVNEYVCKYFRLKDKGLKCLLQIKLLFDKELITIMRNPFTTLLVCVLVEEKEGDVPENCSEILNEVVQACFRKYVTKVKQRSASKRKEGSGVISLSEENLLSAAGHLAYNGILQEMTFYPEETVASLCPAGFSEHLLKSGILSTDFTVSRLHPKSFCYFPHRSIQEFLCAKHLEALDLGELKEKLSKLMQKDTFDADMVLFLLGMLRCQPKMKAVLESIFQAINTIYITKRIAWLRRLLCLSWTFYSMEDSMKLLVQISTTCDWVITAISVISDFKMSFNTMHSVRVLFSLYRLKSIPSLQKYIQKERLPPVVVVTDFPFSSSLLQNSEWVWPDETRAVMHTVNNFTIVHLFFFDAESGLKRTKEIDFPPHRETLVTGGSSLRDTDLLDIYWSFVHCKSTKDANYILTKGFKMSVLTITLIPFEDSVKDITALINSLTSAECKVSVLFLVLEDVHDEQHCVRMLTLFSSLQNVQFIKIRTDYRCVCESERPLVKVVKCYGLDCSIIQKYYSKFCPY